MSDTATSQLVQLDARIGVDVSESQSLDDIITQAGFDFDVEKVPVYNPEGEEVNGQFIIRRADTRQNFAVMRKRYTPIPMKAMLEPLIEKMTKWRVVLWLLCVMTVQSAMLTLLLIVVSSVTTSSQ